jgi:cytochrome b6-f complex iron-sulfur subunit
MTEPDDCPTDSAWRRHFLAVLMGSGLAAGYGTFLLLAGRFLYSPGRARRAWLYVAPVAEIPAGGSLDFAAPDGQRVVITRQSFGKGVDDFIALSSVCPHLGCRVHWEPHNQRFFCPCHNGVFDPQGNPQEGPPAAANQKLPRFALRIENDLLYIEVTTALAAGP